MDNKNNSTFSVNVPETMQSYNETSESITTSKISVECFKNSEDIINLLIKTEKLGKEDDKLTIQFKAAGNAPILKNNKIRLGGFNKFASLVEFLKTSLKNSIKENESLFLYCNSNFAPSPSTYIRDLYNNFSISGELIVYYALTEAWG